MGVDNFLELIDEVKEMTQEELTNLTYAIRDRRDYLRAKDLEGFRVSDKVSFTHGQSLDKKTYTGVVEKINRKTIGIKEDGRPWCKWRVSPSLLTKLGEDE